MRVKPNGDLRVWDPEKNGWLPPEGREVSDSDTYWARILGDGDVVVEAASLPNGSSRTKRSPAGASGKPGDDA